MFKIITAQGELDTDSNISDISLNYAIDDILDISKRNTSFSKSITIPGTPNNNKFFKDIYNVNIDNRTFNPVKRMNVEILVGTNSVMSGFMQLIEINNLNGNISYTIQIAGSLKNLITSASESTLSNLDLSRYNHIRSKDNIMKSWDGYNTVNGSLKRTGDGEGYFYPYIVNGNSKDIWSNWYVYDAFPAVYLRTIILEILDYLDLTVTSKFLDSEYLRKIIVPFNKDKLQLSEKEVNDRKCIIGITPTNFTGGGNNYAFAGPFQTRGSQLFQSIDQNYQIGYPNNQMNRESGVNYFQDNENQFANSFFTCSKAGTYDINIDLKCFPCIYRTDNSITTAEFKEGNFTYRYEMYVERANGTRTLLDSSISTAEPTGVLKFQISAGEKNIQTPYFDLATPLVMTTSASNIFLGVGDKIKFAYYYRYPQEVKWMGLSDEKKTFTLAFKDSFDGAFSKFTVVPSSNESYGNDLINMNQVLDGSIKIKDFFLDFCKTFNLLVLDNPNKPNDLIIEPRDDFFASKQQVLDWDEEKKLDNNSNVKIMPMSELDAKIYEYTYSTDEDFYNKKYTEETKKVYSVYKEEVENDFSDKTQKTSILFAPTPCSSVGISSRVAPFFCSYSNEEFSPMKTKVRLLFKKMVDCNPFYLMDAPGQASTTLTKYPYAGTYDTPINAVYSLDFGRNSKLYWDAGVNIPNQNLFEKFHKQTLNSIKDVNAKMMECYLYLTPKDIANFDFRNIIFLKNSYWRVVKIQDYNPTRSDALTKVVLYKIVDLNIIGKFQVQVPTSNSSCPVDVIMKPSGNRHIYVSDSGLEVTQDCCKQLGGTFINGVCQVSYGRVKPGGIYSSGKPIKDRTFPERVNLTTKEIIGGNNTVPILDRNGPKELSKWNSSRETVGAIKTNGKGNYVPRNSGNGFILGDNSSITPNVSNAMVIGNGITATEDNTFYFNGIKINESGNILHTNYIIDAGIDEVFNFNKVNPIEIIDGGLNSVRNPGGASYARPIIDGNAKIN